MRLFSIACNPLPAHLHTTKSQQPQNTDKISQVPHHCREWRTFTFHAPVCGLIPAHKQTPNNQQPYSAYCKKGHTALVLIPMRHTIEDFSSSMPFKNCYWLCSLNYTTTVEVQVPGHWTHGYSCVIVRTGALSGGCGGCS